MFAVDRITEDGKKAIVSLLNKSLEIEYAFIFNYPQLIHQLVNIERIPQKGVVKKLEFLGKVSVQHAGWIMQLIKGLGGEPQLPVGVIGRMTNIPSLLLEQLDKEKLVQSLFQQAKLVAEQNQAKGILAKMKTMEVGARDMVKERSRTIRILERLEIDEGRHIKLVQSIFSELNLPMQQ